MGVEGVRLLLTIMNKKCGCLEKVLKHLVCRVCVCVCVCVCGCVCVFLCVCVSLYVYAYVCVSGCVYMCVSAYLCASSFTSMCDHVEADLLISLARSVFFSPLSPSLSLPPLSLSPSLSLSLSLSPIDYIMT